MKRYIYIIITFNMFMLFGNYALGAELSKSDLPLIFNSENKVEFSRKYSGKSISLDGKVSGYYTGEGYMVIWVETDGNRVGCLSNPDDVQFDELKKGSMVIINGAIHHIDHASSGKSLVLARGCTVSSSKLSEIDFPDIINSGNTDDFSRRYKGKRISVNGDVSGHHIGIGYMVMWVNINNTKIGCLDNPDSTQFDGITIGKNVNISGEIDHIEGVLPDRSLVLSRGCSIN
jgi:hypothetical protein